MVAIGARIASNPNSRASPCDHTAKLLQHQCSPEQIDFENRIRRGLRGRDTGDVNHAPHVAQLLSRLHKGMYRCSRCHIDLRRYRVKACINERPCGGLGILLAKIGKQDDLSRAHPTNNSLPDRSRPNHDDNICHAHSPVLPSIIQRRSWLFAKVRDFRSKEEFAEEVLDRYFLNNSRFVKAALDDKSLSPRQRLKRYLDIISGVLEDAKWKRGCLIGDFSLETASQSELLRQRLAAIFQEWRVPFAICIAEAQAAGEIALANFFAQGVLRLGKKLAPVLWQFPPRFVFDPVKLETFFKMLPRTMKQAA
jgi:hypothetical protein